MRTTVSSVVVGEAKTLIERPVDDVFAFVSDPDNETKWHVDMIDIRRTEDTGSAAGLENSWTLGSSYTVTTKFFRRTEQEVEVTAFDPNRRIEFTTLTGPLRPIATCLFEPVDGETLFTRHIEIPIQGWARLMKPMMQRWATQRQAIYVDKLKSLLEGDG